MIIMILFRARTLVDSDYGDYGEWIEGFYVCFNEEEHRIYTGYAEKDCGEYYPDFVRVDPKTVRQYTGICDKNGNMIFEGDILKGMGGLHRVYFDTSLACFEWAKINGNWEESFSGFADEYEIIGNIHDNPELLNN